MSKQLLLTEEQRKMYAAEKLNNFRWISKLVATYSDYTLTSVDLVPEALHQELAELGELFPLRISQHTACSFHIRPIFRNSL